MNFINNILNQIRNHQIGVLFALNTPQAVCFKTKQAAGEYLDSLVENLTESLHKVGKAKKDDIRSWLQTTWLCDRQLTRIVNGDNECAHPIRTMPKVTGRDEAWIFIHPNGRVSPVFSTAKECLDWDHKEFAERLYEYGAKMGMDYEKVMEVCDDYLVDAGAKEASSVSGVRVEVSCQ